MSHSGGLNFSSHEARSGFEGGDHPFPPLALRCFYEKAGLCQGPKAPIPSSQSIPFCCGLTPVKVAPIFGARHGSVLPALIGVSLPLALAREYNERRGVGHQTACSGQEPRRQDLVSLRGADWGSPLVSCEFSALFIGRGQCCHELLWILTFALR